MLDSNHLAQESALPGHSPPGIIRGGFLMFIYFSSFIGPFLYSPLDHLNRRAQSKLRVEHMSEQGISVSQLFVLMLSSDTKGEKLGWVGRSVLEHLPGMGKP